VAGGDAVMHVLFGRCHELQIDLSTPSHQVMLVSPSPRGG
jgi:hypothetical protein